MAVSTLPSILLVDDDPTNLQLLKATLKRLDADLRLARSGEEALAQARQHRPTLVLLDVMMPGIDGFETCRQLKADPGCAETAVIFLSALDDARDKVQGLSLGAVDYIAKPFQPQEVLARVQTHLTLQQLKAELAERNRQLAAANQQILEAVAEGICGFDQEGRVSFANPAACQLTGQAEHALLGQARYGSGLLLGADARPLPERATPVYASLVRGETVRSDTLLLQRRGASPVPIALTSAPIRRGDAVQGAVLAVRDISERKRQEEALHEALAEVERLKERLAAENAYLRAEIRSDRQFGEIVGQSQALLAVLEQVRRVAPTKSSVLIQGESGTGKEATAPGATTP